MKNVTRFGLTTLACLILTACGSSGGGSDNNGGNNGASNSIVSPANNQSGSNQSTSKPSTGVNNSTSADNAAGDANKTGAVTMIIDEETNENQVRYSLHDLTDASNLNTITVDGQTIRVAYQDQGIYAGTWTKMNTVQSCCGRFSDMRFGAIGSTGPNQKDIVFYNGNPTQTMPTAGTANYNGYFIVTGNKYPEIYDDYLTGNAAFAVDFSAKTLNGTMNAETVDVINLNANISGNSFTGSANSASLSGTAKVEGKFYGENAKELGGMFKAADWVGAFGASK